MPARAEPGTAYLIDERWGVAYPLVAERTGIGRHSRNAIVIRDAAASRFHAEVCRDALGYVLRPLSSTETRVNGALLQAPHALTEGDVVEVVYTRLRFTASALPPDVTIATGAAAVDPTLAERKTEARELPDTERLRPVRRPAGRPLWWIVGLMAVVALVVAEAVRLIVG